WRTGAKGNRKRGKPRGDRHGLRPVKATRGFLASRARTAGRGRQTRPEAQHPPFLSHPAGTVRSMGDADKLLSDLNDRQREAVTTLVAPLAILAGAGSGKTRVLTRRIAWQAAEGIVDPRHVLAVTLTRQAA